MTQVPGLVIALLLAAGALAPAGAAAPAAAPPPSPCRACHAELAQKLPPGHEAAADRRLTLCVACHREGGAAASLRDRLHATHQPILGANCAACHEQREGRMALLAGPAAPGPPANTECLACHGMPALGKGRPGLVVAAAHLEGSAHRALTCVQCHADALRQPHGVKLQPVRCQACHRKPAAAVPASAHRKLGGVGCVACHGSHQVGRAVAAGDALCGACHREEAQGVATGIHAAARANGKQHLPTCTTCHTAHAVKRREDPTSPIHRSHIHETCAVCHADPKVIAEQEITRPRVIPLFEQSIHGRAIREKGNLEAATCTDCHRAHAIRRGADPTSSIFKGNVAATCGRCHRDEARRFQASVHGGAVARGVHASPTCTDCHGEHGITGTREAGSRVAPLTVSKTCAACHEATPVVQEFGLAARRAGTFFNSFHGLAVRGGSPVAANCASCHSTHDILPSSDPRSKVYPTNLPATCGQCHPGAGIQLAAARVHVAPGMGEHWTVALARRTYLWLILVTVGGMVAHNALDFLARLRKRWRAEMRGALEGEEVDPDVAHRLFARFTLNERIQHLVLLTSFTVLVVSGFALKFPESWWAEALVRLERGYAVRAWVHRAAGVLMTLAGAYHLAYLLGTRRGRTQLGAMWPRWRDVRDAWGLVAFNLGLRAARPAFPRFDYTEKMEYWAVVWGTFVMGATGFVMWFQSAVLRRWPLWTIDLATVIHYYEAWLATLAIVVWHLYAVIFRPGTYPMSWVWLSGKITGEQMAEEHQAELEEILAGERRDAMGEEPADRPPGSEGSEPPPAGPDGGVRPPAAGPGKDQGGGGP